MRLVADDRVVAEIDFAIVADEADLAGRVVDDLHPIVVAQNLEFARVARDEDLVAVAGDPEMQPIAFDRYAFGVADKFARFEWTRRQCRR